MKKGADPSNLTPDALIKRWSDWLEHTKYEALRFYSFRFQFENVAAMFKSNEALKSDGGHTWDWIVELQKTYFLVSIRRELEEGGGHLTLMNFLYELEDLAEVTLTRERYIALYDDSVLNEHGLPDKHFDAKLGSMCKLPKGDSKTDCISPESIRQARERLKEISKNVLKYANWAVLHRTSVEPPSVTWGDLYRVMNQIFDTYATYYNLLTAGSWVGRYPVPQYDWTAPYTYAWITKEFQPWEPPK